MTTVKEYILKAADEIERRGLAHGTLANHDSVRDDDICQMCTLGALSYVYFGNPYGGYEERDEGYADLVRAVAAYVGEATDDPGLAIEAVYGWNDAHLGDITEKRYIRNTAEVVQTLREIAESVD